MLKSMRESVIRAHYRQVRKITGGNTCGWGVGGCVCVCDDISTK